MRKKFWIPLSVVAVIGMIVAYVVSTPTGSRTQSKSTVARSCLYNIGLAMVQEAERHGGRFFSAIYDKDGKPLLSWRVKVLPFLEANELYRQFHLNEPWDSEHNKTLIEKMPTVYKNPLSGNLHGKTVYQVPTGKETIFFDTNGTSLEQITDGAASTILLVETDTEHAVPWTKPEDITIDPRDPAARLQRWGGSFLAVFASGLVRPLSDDTDPATLWSYFTRAGGEEMSEPGS
jgi:hypothetical protein